MSQPGGDRRPGPERAVRTDLLTPFEIFVRVAILGCLAAAAHYAYDGWWGFSLIGPDRGSRMTAAAYLLGAVFGGLVEIATESSLILRPDSGRIDGSFRIFGYELVYPVLRREAIAGIGVTCRGSSTQEDQHRARWRFSYRVCAIDGRRGRTIPFRGHRIPLHDHLVPLSDYYPEDEGGHDSCNQLGRQMAELLDVPFHPAVERSEIRVLIEDDGVRVTHRDVTRRSLPGDPDWFAIPTRPALVFLAACFLFIVLWCLFVIE